MKKSPQNLTRRSIIKSVLRATTFGALCSGGGVIAAKKIKLSRQGKCINIGICMDCRTFGNCDLPQALLAQKYLERKVSETKL